jgi:copper homeostasis protein (lipoprotein)
LLTRFAGVLPCADCSGLKTELRLFTSQPSGRPDHYEMTETYLATGDGDKTSLSAGNWAILRGTPTNPNATVYQLDSDQPNRRRNFLLIGDELRTLDRDQREIQSPLPLSIRKTPGGESQTLPLLSAIQERRFT